MPLFSRGYLLCWRAVSENSGFGKIMGDPKGASGANPAYSATAKPSGISFEISPLEKAHGLILKVGGMAYGFWQCHYFRT
jgi:hypothetical protein